MKSACLKTFAIGGRSWGRRLVPKSHSILLGDEHEAEVVHEAGNVLYLEYLTADV